LRLDARLTILLCKKIIVAKFKEVKTGWSIILLRKFMAQKVLFANDDDDDDDELKQDWIRVFESH
jgi:hypothetical protein